MGHSALVVLVVLCLAGHSAAFVGINTLHRSSVISGAVKARGSTSSTCSWSMNAAPLSRRDALILTGSAALGAPWTRDVASAADSSSPEITAKAYFDIKIVGRTKALENEKWEKIIARDKRAGGAGTGDQVLRIVFGLYGKDAPETVDTFVQLVKGTLAAPCIDEDEVVDNEAFGVSERTKLTKRQIYRQCKAQEVANVGYQYSQVYRIVKGKYTGLGRLNKLYRQPPRNSDENTLKHASAGLLSAPKNGGEFEFLVTAGATPELDKEHLVFGQVLEGAELMEALNNAPVSQGQFLEGAFKLTGKAIGDVRAQVTSKERPLQKMSVVQCGLL